MSAAAAISSTVVASKPSRSNRSSAASSIRRAVWRFLRARSPSSVATSLTLADGASNVKLQGVQLWHTLVPTKGDGHVTGLLERIGVFSVRRRRLVLGMWLAVIVAVVVVSRVVGAEEVDDFEVPGVESDTAMEVLEERFPERAGASATVVFHVDGGAVTDPANAAVIAETMTEVRAMPSVLSATDPLAGARSVSPDGRTAFSAVQFDAAAADLGREVVDELFDTAGPAESAGVQVEYGGELPTVLKERHTGAAEAIGIVAAVIVLLIMFRSKLAAVLPLGTAIAGLAVGLALVGLLAGAIDIPSVAPRLATMIGLGVGIDYALFVLSRHRDQLAAGMPVEESVGRTNATAGQAVVFAGGTVVVAILGLQLADRPQLVDTPEVGMRG
ncbi:MAG TPA: hypothetical protein DCS55_05585 [Acidimicrobiaceae bacterium]|nr:hypothetical protein [Acidimicrobiaceae bacterium]